MDFSIIREFLPLYVDATWVTLKIAFFGILFSLGVGLFCALVQYMRIPVLRQVVTVYIELSRNTPLLVQLFFIYFGLPKLGIVWSGMTCAVVGLTFLGGSYMAEAFRSGIDSVEKIQMESALSLGMTTRVAIRCVLLPQALAVSVPGITANIVFLVKETSVVSIIAISDLMFVTKDIIGNDYETWYALGLLVFFYLLILLPISIVASRVERRMRHAGFGN